MAATVGEVIELMQAFAPEYLACEGDPVGLHAGARACSVSKIMLAMDATEPIVDAAIDSGVDMLVTHHPRFFRGLKNLDEDRSENALAAKLLRAGIALYCAHTNLDIAPGGVNDTLADLAGMAEKRRPLQTVYRDTILKLTVFVPEENLEDVRQAICAAGAGCIGNYSECTYRVCGIGSFLPGAEANPHIGQQGRLEEVSEWRLEAVVPKSAKSQVIRALTDAHPYEEPAYDLIATERYESYGLGRVGMLETPCSLKKFAAKIKDSCKSRAACLLGDPDKIIGKAAVWGGSGAPAGAVIGSGAEVLVCGELSYHDAELLQRAGVAALVLGHGPSEQVVLPVVAENLREGLEGVEVIVSACLWPDFVSV